MNYLDENLEIEKIEVKKTKVNLVISQYVDEYNNRHDPSADLILKAVLMGGSANCINQYASENRLTPEQFEEIQEARRQILEITSNLKFSISNALENVEPKNHKFY